MVIEVVNDKRPSLIHFTAPWNYEPNQFIYLGQQLHEHWNNTHHKKVGEKKKMYGIIVSTTNEFCTDFFFHFLAGAVVIAIVAYTWKKVKRIDFAMLNISSCANENDIKLEMGMMTKGNNRKSEWSCNKNMCVRAFSAMSYLLMLCAYYRHHYIIFDGLAAGAWI